MYSDFFLAESRLTAIVPQHHGMYEFSNNSWQFFVFFASVYKYLLERKDRRVIISYPHPCRRWMRQYKYHPLFADGVAGLFE